jgi:RHS repeat-associated protein
MRSLSVAACAALASVMVWAMPVGSAHAQALPQLDTEYCYADLCYSDLAKAESAMRAANTLYGDALKYKHSTYEDPPPVLGGSKLKLERLHYGVEDREPLSLNAPVYAPNFTSNPAPDFCASAGDPVYGNLCASESELIQGIVRSYQNAHGASSNVVAESPTGGYFEEFAISGPQGGTKGGLQLNYDNNPAQQRMVTIKIFNAQGVQTWGFQHRLYKYRSFDCPAGYTGKNGRNPAYDPSTGAPVYPMYLCEASVSAVITTRLRAQCLPTPNVPSQDGNHPCFPATGDKARFETDFEFAGRPFVRSYHSLRQTGQSPELAPGWTHTYSDRMLGSPYQSSLGLIADNGYYETFRRIGRSSRFVSPETAARVIDLVVENGVYVFRLSDGGDLVRFYREDGRLKRIESRGGLWKLVFAYEGPRLVSITDVSGRQLKFEYVSNRLTTIRLPNGRNVGYTYDPDRNLQMVRYADGATRTYHYNEAGLSDANDPHALTGISDDGVRRLTFGYDDRNRVRLSQLQNGSGPAEKTVLAYSGDAQATVTGTRGESRSYALSGDSGFRRVTALVAGDGSVNNTYTGALPQESRDKRNIVTRYEYTADGAYASARIEAYGTPQERKIVTVRNADYRVTSITTHAKSGSGYVAKAQTSFTYNSRGQVLTQTRTDPATNLSRVVTTVYCEQVDVDAGACPLVGLVKSVDGPLAGAVDTVAYAYRMADDPGCATAPTTCAYRKGDPWKVTNALNHVSETLRRDGSGRTLSTKDANGVTTDFEYDARGRLIARKVRGTNDASEADDRIVRMVYTPEGLVERVIQPDGTATTYAYDGAQRLIGIADDEGNRVDYILNAAGDRTQEDTRDPTGTLRRALSWTYNTLGQVQAQTDAYGRSTGYAYAGGNLDQTTDALGRVSDNTHDPLNRLTRTLQDMNGIAVDTRFEYDALDNLTKVTDPNGLNTTYGYNGFSDLTQLQSPDTGTTTYGYDSAGRRSSRTDARGVQVQYAYDALNRPTTVNYPADSSLNVTYQYDLAQGDCTAGETFLIGRLAKMTDGSGSTTYCYNRFGQMTRKVQRTQGKTLEMRWNYAANGRLQSMITPGGAIIDYVYNAQGRVVELGVTTEGQARQKVVHDVLYHPYGGPARWTSGVDRMLVRTQNLNGQPGVVQAQALNGTPIDGLSLGYEFDEVGNLKRLRDGNQADPPARIYGYDGLNRLIEAKDASNVVWQSYGYDKTGNRTSVGRLRTVEVGGNDPTQPGGNTTTTQWASSNYTYHPGNHRLLSTGAQTRTYDAAGNLILVTPMGTETVDPPPGGGESPYGFVYNAANRMSAATQNGATVMNYRYNGRGERVYRQGGGKTAHTVFDPSGHWIGDYDANGWTIQEAIWLGDLPVGLLASVNGTQRLYTIEPDALGSPRVVIDPTRGAQGTVVWRWDLAGEAFGEDKPNEDPDGDGTAFVLDMRFPGQQSDSASGLSYNYFRDYESGTGRYVQSDPIGLADGPSTYGYVAQNPFITYDNFGLAGFQNFPPDKQKLMENAQREAIRKMKECKCKCADPKTPYCFDEKDKAAIIANLYAIDWIWVPEGYPGDPTVAAYVKVPWVEVYPAAFSPNACPLASTMAHEANHYQRARGVGEGRSYYIEEICFGCRHYPK